MIYASLYHVDSTLPSLQDQLDKWPKAAKHDGIHYLFADLHPDTDPIFIADFKDEEGLRLSGDELAFALAAILSSDSHINTVLAGTQSEFQTLYKHPAWRIWCSTKYGEEYFGTEEEGRKQFEKDWTNLGELIPNWPEYSTNLTYKDGRELIYSIFNPSLD